MLCRWIEDAHDYRADVLRGHGMRGTVCGTSEVEDEAGNAVKPAKQELKTGVCLGYNK